MENSTMVLTPSLKNLVRLPYQPEVFLCKETLTRWIYNGKELYRDFEGEGEWKKMGTYVGKTYQEVFMDSFKSVSGV